MKQISLLNILKVFLLLLTQKTCKITPFYLSIYNQNVNDLNTKINNLNIHIPASNFDLYIFTETWLSENVKSQELMQ